ncbi:ORF86 [Haliotid herpesvirus 1]|uniref:Chloride channel CLIC-like protein 1 n=1 Tax=Abalone herpesvirus Taiwan/2005 TaxID=1821058 RepID=A0A145VVM9_9VIRU|nr:hypothetical protein tc_p044 [Abalone herpesvirus Taiwan/2004]AMW36254.1 hypothetical protein tc2005_p110c [Abalone herpesvirus Taiwan/2005]UCX57077.1 ORF86 [Haliotid herpesvirus 1]
MSCKNHLEMLTRLAVRLTTLCKLKPDLECTTPASLLDLKSDFRKNPISAEEGEKSRPDEQNFVNNHFRLLFNSMERDLKVIIESGATSSESPTASTDAEPPRLGQFVSNDLPQTFLLVAGLLLVCVGLNYVLNRISWRFLIHRMCVVAFLASVIINFIHDYEKVAAKRYLKLRQGLPENCMERGGSWRTVLSSLISYLFIITPEDQDECVTYAKAIVIEPLFEVTPMNAILTSVSTLVLTPVEQLAKSTNTIFKSLLYGIPSLLVPVVIGVILYVVTMIMICYNRYSVNFLSLLNINPTAALVHPAPPPPVVVTEKYVRARPKKRVLSLKIKK